MRNLFEFFARYGVFLVFIALEFLCFNLVIRNNQRQSEIYHEISTRLTASMQKRMSAITDFWDLGVVNDSLRMENARLHEQLANRAPTFRAPGSSKDSTIHKYNTVAARVIQNSIGARNNYITIDKGSKSGIHRGMGVISANGPAGIVVAETPNYAKIMSILHSNTMISASIRSKGYFGSLVWRSANPKRMELNAIPKHARMRIGDTVVTSGYSNVFPPDLLIGVIDTFWLPRGSNFYRARVELGSDISKLSSVYVVANLSIAERDTLDKSILNE